MAGLTGQGQVVLLPTRPAGAGLLARKQRELGGANKRSYGCWSRQRDRRGVRGLWAMAILHTSHIQELLNKMQ